MTTRNDEIRGALADVLDFEPTDQEIAEALEDEPRIEHQAKWWGWSDYEVHDMLVAELKRVHEWTISDEELEYRRAAEQERDEFLALPRWRRWLLRRWWMVQRWAR